MAPGDIYERAFESAPTGLLWLERDTGRILKANAAFLRMAGRSAAELSGRSFWRPPLIADADAGSEIRAHLAAGCAVTGVELPLQAGDGRWLLLEVSGRTLDDMIQLEVRDATCREQARLAERVEMLRLMAAMTAAEFEKVHRALRTMGELLLIGAGQGRPVLDELDEIQRASERASGIAAQLWAFSGGLTLQVQPVALNDLVEDMLPRLRQLFGRSIEIVLDLAQETPLVTADPDQVRQIILKLAANSRDALENGGTFCLQTGSAAGMETGLGSSGPSGSPYGMLAISDSGPGLDDESWAHLFEPFFSTKANGRGLGLGLAAVYGIVRQSGGRLWAYSQPGKGTTFRIYLPSAGAHFPALPMTRPNGPRDSATILLVEANDGMRAVMANLLKRHGYRVWAALHSQEALRVTKTQGPPDLLITRPDPELARCLARMRPQMQILYLGVCADGASAVLPMPFEPETLLAEVSELLSRPL